MTTDPDDDRLFTSAENETTTHPQIGVHRALPERCTLGSGYSAVECCTSLRCPDCGRRSLYDDFAPAGGVFEDPAPRFRRARRMCRNEGCPTNAHA